MDKHPPRNLCLGSRCLVCEENEKTNEKRRRKQRAWDHTKD